MATHSVASDSEAREAIEAGASGDVFRIPPGAVIDTGDGLPNLPDGARIVSEGDGREGPSATLRVTEHVDGSAFTARGDIHVEGIEFVGPCHDQLPLDRDAETVGLHAWGDRATVDRCSFHGWPVAGFRIGGINPWRETHATVTNSTFRYNLMDGYGYGAYITNGRMDIDGCDFDFNRHAVASTGRPSTHYRVRDSWFGRHTVYHVLDVHGRETDDGPPVAGGETIIGPGNTIEATYGVGETGDRRGAMQEAVKIRGVPAECCVIFGNRFGHAERPEGPGGDGEAILQESVDEWTRLVEFDNEYGL